MIAVIAPFAARGPGPRADRHRDRDWSGGGLPVGLSDRDLNAAACIEKHASWLPLALQEYWANGPPGTGPAVDSGLDRARKIQIHGIMAWIPFRLSIHLLVSAIAMRSLLRPWREATAL